MVWLDEGLKFLNKLVPSRKGALMDQINTLTVKYQRALREGRDTDAAVYCSQLAELRKKVGFTGGDV